MGDVVSDTRLTVDVGALLRAMVPLLDGSMVLVGERLVGGWMRCW